MEAAFQREVRELPSWALRLPVAPRITRLVSERATLEKTIKLIRDVVEGYRWQVAAEARKLKGRTVRESCRNIWEFCYGHIQYRRDEDGKEQVRSPRRTLRDAKEGVDCDCFTVLVSALLTNMGIGHRLRITSYPDPENPAPDFQHIYVVVPHSGGHITIDPVTDRFDCEVPWLNKKDIDMSLEFLDGTPSRLGNTASEGKKNRTRHNPAPRPRPHRDAKLLVALQRAKAAGEVPQSMSVEQYKDHLRQQFIAKHGMTPEAWKRKVEAEMERRRREGEALFAQKLAKLRAELDKRGVGYPPNAGRDQLIRLLNENPAPRPLANGANKLNKLNPLAAATRQGFILAAKLNYMGAGKLVWALTPKGTAVAMGMKDRDWDKLSAAWTRLRGIHYSMGGKVEKLAAALKSGVYNKRSKVVAPGTGRSNAAGLSGYGGLGAITASAALAAASAVLGAIAAIVRAVEVPGRNGGSIEPGSAAEVEQIVKKAGGMTPLDTITTIASGIAEAANGPDQTAGAGYDDEIVRDRETGGGKTPDPPKSFDWGGALKWGGIALGAGAVGYMAWQATRPAESEKQAALAGHSKSLSKGEKPPAQDPVHIR